MIRRTLLVLAALATALAAAFFLGMRSKWPPVLNAVRRTNRAFFNPRQMSTAGTPGAYAGVIRHTGRRSGVVRETPVGTVRHEDGFVIALVYGPDTDWLRNVLASGTAEIVHEGSTHEVDRPEVVAIDEVAGAFGPGELRNLGLFGVTECLRVHDVAGPADGPDEATGGGTDRAG